MKKIMIMSGEASGDLHGANLAREIRSADSSVVLFGVGSTHMRDAGVQLLADASEISVVGISEVISRLGVIYRVLGMLKRFLREKRPDVLVLIDFPDFNIMLGKAARKLGIPVVYYISPQVWVWRKGRIKTLARLVRTMIVVFPFEVPLYQEKGVDVRFVGHPLTDVVRCDISAGEARKSLALDPDRRTIALLPGSRRTEIQYLLPDMIAAAAVLHARFPDLQFVLPVAHTLDPAWVRGFTRQGPVPVQVVDGRVYEVLKAADAAIVTSGTATLETALMAVPMVIIYRISRLTYSIISKMVGGVDHVGLVNIVAGERLVPELIQQQANPQRIADHIATILDDRVYRDRVLNGLLDVRRKLGGAGASARAARVVLETVQNQA